MQLSNRIWGVYRTPNVFISGVNFLLKLFITLYVDSIDTMIRKTWGQTVIEAIAAAWLLLFAGDFLSTFCYHVPEHVFGSLHIRTHHSSNKNFRHYAVLNSNLSVLVDGVLGVVPYLLVAVVLWPLSPVGVGIGLALGQFHVWWRHTTALNWRTPQPITFLCNLLFITTPERHWLHHKNTSLAYGDIFTFFERPAEVWMRILRLVRYRYKITTVVRAAQNTP